MPLTEIRPHHAADQAAAGDDFSATNGAEQRRLVQQRSIEVQVWRRDDGLWDAEVELIDRKTRDFDLASCRRPAGQPIHHMRLRLTVNSNFDVLDATALTLAAPYDQDCVDVNAAYRSLIGLNLLKGFAQAAKQKLGGAAGCTHMTELTRVVPTAVVQAFAGEVEQWQSDPDVQPFQLGHCQALRLDGPAVLRYFPRWAKPVR